MGTGPCLRRLFGAFGLLAVVLAAGCQSTPAVRPAWDSLPEMAATPMWGRALAPRAVDSAETSQRLASHEVVDEATSPREAMNGSDRPPAEIADSPAGSSGPPAAANAWEDRSEPPTEHVAWTPAPISGPWGHPLVAEVDGACGDGEPIGPGCESAGRFSVDWDRAVSRCRDDAVGIVNWNNGLILAGALAAAVAIHQDLDGEIREYTARHPDCWGDASQVLGWMGEVQYQVPLLAAVYASSLHEQDAERLEFSRTLLSAYTINGLATLAVKGIANTDRPSPDWNSGGFGFPSFHTASSFCMAAVVDEYYGPRAGLPAYVLAGLIGWSRIDERDHELSDVVFGAAMGYVIGKAVSGRHLRGDSRVRCLPYFDPADQTGGFQVDWSY